MKNYFSIRSRLLIGMLALTMLSFGLAFAWFYSFTESSILAHFEETTTDILKSAQKEIAVEDLQPLIAASADSLTPGSGDELDAHYQAVLKWLQLVQKVDPRTHTYVYFYDGSNIRLLIDSSINRSSPGTVQFQEVYPLETSLFPDFLRGLQPPANPEKPVIKVNGFKPHTGRFGEQLTAVIPILDSDGHVIAAAGVDVDTTYLYTPLRSSAISLAIAFSIALVIIFIVIWLTAGRITRSLSTLTQAAARIGAGDYNVDLSIFKDVRYDDEISTTASVFEIMVSKVYHREEALKQEVRDLQIIVDEAKRQAQVSEIVDSDFFKVLQAKSNRLRRRASRLEDGSEEAEGEARSEMLPGDEIPPVG
jgi:methyl-accepting chemotaxis protein